MESFLNFWSDGFSSLDAADLHHRRIGSPTPLRSMLTPRSHPPLYLVRFVVRVSLSVLFVLLFFLFFRRLFLSCDFVFLFTEALVCRVFLIEVRTCSIVFVVSRRVLALCPAYRWYGLAFLFVYV